MDIKSFSTIYNVRRLTARDVPEILDIFNGNRQYYEYCGAAATVEQIKSDLTALPPGKEMADKYYVGFYLETELIAVMDLIDGYPDEKTAFMGFFMMNSAYQGIGMGSSIISELCVYLEQLGFERARLGYEKSNPQSSHFWQKNGFEFVKEVQQEHGIIVVAERNL